MALNAEKPDISFQFWNWPEVGFFEQWLQQQSSRSCMESHWITSMDSVPEHPWPMPRDASVQHLQSCSHNTTHPDVWNPWTVTVPQPPIPAYSTSRRFGARQKLKYDLGDPRFLLPIKSFNSWQFCSTLALTGGLSNKSNDHELTISSNPASQSLDTDSEV